MQTRVAKVPKKKSEREPHGGPLPDCNHARRCMPSPSPLRGGGFEDIAIRIT